jgi:hypothetical protein
MIASTVGRGTLASCLRVGRYCIRLKVSKAAREDAWDICRVAVDYGGIEVHDCCFAFPNEEQWLSVVEALRFCFGPEYFEAVDSGEST